MTAFQYRVALIALMASTLAACAMGAPEYPTQESASIAPAHTATGQGSVIAVSNLAQAEPQRSDTAAADVVQTDQTTPAPAPAAQMPPPPTPVTQAPLPTTQPEPAPIVEAPLGPNVQPPVNRRPGAENQSFAQPPAERPKPAERQPAQALRAARVRTPPPPPPAHPLVAGRVENVHDTSHTVEVEKGDTVNTISDGLMTTKDDLIRANRLRKPYELEVGRSLKIPVHKVYVVQAGDSLYGIARRFSAPVDVLSDLNRLDAKSRLRPGQKIALPELAKDTGPIERPGESAAESARNEEAVPPRRETAAQRRQEAAPLEESPPPASPSQRADAYAPPSAPRPYESLSPRPPSRPAYTPSTPMPETAPSVSDAQIQLAGRGRFVWPVRGDMLSGFGAKPGGQRNDGIDIAAPEHSPVRASASGDVVYAGDQIPGFGNLVLIKHEGGWVTAYAHLAMSEVKIKEHVSQGAEIGQVGLTGGVDQPQLHFEIRYAPSPRDKARPIDPNLVLSNLADQ
jgi:murein DD-endopeptidase MepM/ murein hydrolase activator NlpD